MEVTDDDIDAFEEVQEMSAAAIRDPGLHTVIHRRVEAPRILGIAVENTATFNGHIVHMVEKDDGLACGEARHVDHV